MEKRRVTRDASSDESCNKMSEQRGKGRQNKIRKLWSLPRAMKDNRSQITKIENQDEQRLSTESQRPGRQHQRRQNSDPTQGDAVPNISQNLRKKRSNQY
ncbi:hypothetical protein F2Q69_00015711 [Brassica cretica]|uniref:Uncharacterized protein n=1 Tax=Brassica cretica TaxID=69181 RepID=A0A8S9QRI5_BRACR|nr:hypothetical protein F2Q69_00015711 [Brassica cretica]